MRISLLTGVAMVLVAAVVLSRAEAQNQTDAVKATDGKFVRSFLDSHCVRAPGAPAMYGPLADLLA